MAVGNHRIEPLLLHFSTIFIICKFVGLYPHDLDAFRRKSVLRKSRYGFVPVVVSSVTVVVCYNLLMYTSTAEDRPAQVTQSTLSVVIKVCLSYNSLAMMITDQLTALRNQSQIGDIYERIRKVDEKLFSEHIRMDQSDVKWRIRLLTLLTLIYESTIWLTTCIVIYDCAEWRWQSIYWIFTFLPSFHNTLDKIWFAMTLYALRQRFAAINDAIEELVSEHEQWLTQATNVDDYNGHIMPSTLTPQQGNRQLDSSFLRYLYKDMDMHRPKSAHKPNKVSPIVHSLNAFGLEESSPKKQDSPMKQIEMVKTSALNNVNKVEATLTNFCQLHEEICNIAKTLNELWSYPILILMAYGFLIVTATLYFLFCASQKQHIPSSFRSAVNFGLTLVNLSYISGKCIYLIYLSWSTSIESKRTGTCLHKCGNIANNNLLYEIVNHLSLKLLNHSVDFSACGFFTLNMETLFGVIGGITSYLIILIQFNLAAHQAKESISSLSNTNQTLDLIESNIDGNIASTITSVSTSAASTTIALTSTVYSTLLSTN